jgi:ribosomal protein S18 acetylase RimI-like enzyme
MSDEVLKLIQIDVNNIDVEHICCAIGNDTVNIERANLKKEWMKERFKEGLVFKRYDARGKFFIEYIPIEHVWKPLVGENYIVMNCLWVSGRYKGKGLAKNLLNECINNAKKQDMDGVCIVTSKKVMGFLTDKKFFVKHGFETCDTAYPYFELLSYKLNKNASDPAFTDNARNGVFNNNKDFSFVFSNQCPYAEEYAKLMADVCEKRGKTTELVKINTTEDARKYGSPFGTFGIYYNGKFIHHEVMPEKKFNKFLDKNQI